VTPAVYVALGFVLGVAVAGFALWFYLKLADMVDGNRTD